MKRELLIGCGNSRDKKVHGPWTIKEWANLTTLDIDPAVKPDVVHDLNALPYPFEDDSFDEVHAYEVLEHCGQQGDWHFFFAQFYEFWRILKPGGFFVSTVPMWNSPWAWGDPGHTRVIVKDSLVFLDQSGYAQIGTTAMTDYRDVWKGNFERYGAFEEDQMFAFVLRAVKLSQVEA